MNGQGSSTTQGSNGARMLVTGSAGMTGYYVHEVFSDYRLALTDKSSLDVRRISQVREMVRAFAPDIVLNLAAETDIELCERDRMHAFQTNAVGTQNVAMACDEVGALLVHFSTTSVFQGEPERVYTEFDQTHPIHAHGLSKAESERLVERFAQRSIVVRAGWMFGGFGRDKKFVGKLRRMILSERVASIRATVDNKGSPTYAHDCLMLTRRLIESRLLGTFHVVNSGYCTRYEMAQVVGEHYGIHVEPVPSEEFASIVPRPASEMVHTRMLQFYGLSQYMRDWRSALKEYLGRWDELESQI